MVHRGNKYYLYLDEGEAKFNDLFGSTLPLLRAANDTVNKNFCKFYIIGEAEVCNKRHYEAGGITDHMRYECMIKLPKTDRNDEDKFIYLDSADYNQSWFVRNIA